MNRCIWGNCLNSGEEPRWKHWKPSIRSSILTTRQTTRHILFLSVTLWYCMKTEKTEDLTVTFTVAECGEFHGIGAYYEDIPTIEDAIRIYRKMDPARLNGVPAIGVNLHVEGTDCLEDDQVDLLTGKTIDVDFLNYMPDVRDHPSVQDAIKKLVEAFPEKEVNDRETKEQKIQALAGELDRLSYDMDPYEYSDTVSDQEAQVQRIAEDIRNGNIGHTFLLH